MHLVDLLGNLLITQKDSSGVYGGILHYSIVFALVGSAFLVFLYCWKKGRLDMDEEPKIRMMQQEEDDNGQ